MRPPCDAPESSCGTPSGWRAGGRCYRCQKAHTEDTARQRGYGFGDDQRGTVLRLANRGASLEEIATAAGCSVRAIMRAASRDPELDAALSGEDPTVQLLARMGTYLAGLARHAGRREHACKATGVSSNEVRTRRERDPLWADAENAVTAWAESATGMVRRRLSDADLERATEILESGGTKTAAAQALGVAVQALHYHAVRAPDSRLALAWAKRRRGGD